MGTCVACWGQKGSATRPSSLSPCCVCAGESHRHMYTNVHAASHSSPRGNTQISTQWGMDKQTWSVHIMEYCSATKRTRAPTPGSTWMDSENMMPSERSQTPDRLSGSVLLTGPQDAQIPGLLSPEFSKIQQKVQTHVLIEDVTHTHFRPCKKKGLRGEKSAVTAGPRPQR